LRVLLTNDDSVFSEGLLALKDALAELGEVTVVAPLTEQSGVSHAVSLHGLVRPWPVRLADGSSAFAVEGTPADAVNVGLRDVFDVPPDLIASGINKGLNTGANVFYSGTVAAAIEGAMNGILSVAVSTVRAETVNLEGAAKLALKAIRMVMAHADHPPAAYNINLPEPGEEEPQVAFTAQSVESFFDPREQPEAQGEGDCAGPLSDVEAIRLGKISVTPLVTGLTDVNRLRILRESKCRAR